MKKLRTPMAGLILALLAVTPALADGYTISPGDTLKIEVLEDNTLNRAVLVDPKGGIALPDVGSFKVAGQSVDAISAAIAAKIGGNFATPPHVYVALQQVAVPVAGTGNLVDVYVVGEANKAGKLSVKSGTSALQAFAEMGGFTKFAATKRIQIRHADATTTQLNYDAIESGASTAGTMTLKAGDVIIVPQRHLFE